MIRAPATKEKPAMIIFSSWAEITETKNSDTGIAPNIPSDNMPSRRQFT
ncbi:hypothetical protein JCM19232_3667 [Vibrio ishigakensis]|uniref:Uncharacterized protein n=1 Tax=Vibrio ishigakensis TaxID=1481914 RepID=A0A0B8P1R5_9VIBR|nr:hypothetical protein JCM19232_3667 [Vibrio ishigakensis]